VIDGSTGTRVFKPVVKTEGSVLYIARDDDVAAANATLRTTFKPSTAQRKTTRFNAGLSLPLKRSDGGSPATYTAADVARVSLEWVLPDSMSGVERDTLGYMLRDLISESVFKAAYEDLDPPV